MELENVLEPLKWPTDPDGMRTSRPTRLDFVRRRLQTHRRPDPPTGHLSTDGPKSRVQAAHLSTDGPYQEGSGRTLELLNRPGEQAELVALGIGEDDPADIRSLADIDPACPQVEESLQFL